MKRISSRLPAAVLLIACLPVLAQEASSLSREQKEEFLRTAKIIKMKPAPGGVTGTLRATLSDGKFTHDAHVQSIDEQKTEFKSDRGGELNFRDTYKFNIGAWKLARILGLDDMIPPSVERKVNGKTSAVTWWIDDVMADEAQRRKQHLEPPNQEAWNLQMYRVRVFDQLIYNTDRNLGNLLTDKNWKMWMIDHTRAFRLSRSLHNQANLVKCEKSLFEKLKALDEPSLERSLLPYVRKAEIKSLVARRDLIVAFFESQIKEKGESATLYSLDSK